MRVWNTRKQEIESLILPQASRGDEPLTYALTPELILFFGDERGSKPEKAELATVPVAQSESLSCDRA